MPEGYNQNTIPSSSQNDGPTIIQTDIGVKDGQNKCPKCGATEISLNVNNGKLRCNFCRYEFESQKIAEVDINNLQGEIIGSGAQDIVADTNDVLTFKCSSCGAEVVIDTSDATQARCHWCRNTLSVNQQIPNGSIPDVVLPFGITKEVAQAEIEKFVGKRKFFAHPKFKQEFTTDNIMGVYFPYMLVDVNAHSNLAGNGEHETRSYLRGSGKNSKWYYDADEYYIEREYDVVINGLTIESSADKLNKDTLANTNNVINAIMPFDLENCVKWDANYLKGYTSEKRDTNIEQLKPMVYNQAKIVAKFAANSSLHEYDRGVAWSREDFNIKGEHWKAAYLPVWLYSYQHTKGSKSMLHYVAVNARTKEIMGSVPLYLPKLILISILIMVIAIVIGWLYNRQLNFGVWIVGVIFFIYNFVKYRNTNARHKFELETKSTTSNLRKVDKFIKSKKGMTKSKIVGANNEDTGLAPNVNDVLAEYAEIGDKFVNNSQISRILKRNDKEE